MSHLVRGWRFVVEGRPVRGSARTIEQLQEVVARTQVALRTDDGRRDAILAACHDDYLAVLGAINQDLVGLDGAALEVALSMLDLDAVGWTSTHSDAGSFVHERVPWLVEQLGSLLPSAWRAYLSLHIGSRVRSQRLLAGDTEPSWPELRIELRRWETFVARHPTFVHAERERVDNAAQLRVLLAACDHDC